MPQPITKPLIASSNFLEFSYEIVTSTYYHASLCFMTTVTSGFICQIAVIQGLDSSTRVIRRTIPPIGQNLTMQNPGEQCRKYI